MREQVSDVFANHPLADRSTAGTVEYVEHDKLGALGRPHAAQCADIPASSSAVWHVFGTAFAEHVRTRLDLRRLIVVPTGIEPVTFRV